MAEIVRITTVKMKEGEFSNFKDEISTPPSPPSIMFQAFVGVGVEGSGGGGRGSGSGGGGCSGSGCNCGGYREDNNADWGSSLYTISGFR